MRDFAAMRRLIVCADDLGMGPETSRGILDLAVAGRITGTVLLVNAADAEAAVRAWRKAAPACDLGWHPCLTSDAPILPPRDVPSLVDRDGRFLPLGAFMKRWTLGRIRDAEVAAEWRAQLHRYREICGANPDIINSHQHVAVFPPLGAILADLLKPLPVRPYVRRVRETKSMLRQIPGARLKRFFLSNMARRANRDLDVAGFPGCDVLAGIANHGDVHEPGFFSRWLARTPGHVVELMVHPGHRDETLIGRDCVVGDGCLERREKERELLAEPAFLQAVSRAGFRLCRPSESTSQEGRRHAG